MRGRGADTPEEVGDHMGTEKRHKQARGSNHSVEDASVRPRSPQGETGEAITTTLVVGSAPAAISTPGDIAIADGARVRDSMHAAGHARVGRGADVEGALTALRDVDLADESRLGGPLEVGGALRCGRGVIANARVTTRGPLVTHDGLTRAAFVIARSGLVVEDAPPSPPRGRDAQ